MGKRGKQRLGVCAALVLLILGGFMDNNVKTELKTLLNSFVFLTS